MRTDSMQRQQSASDSQPSTGCVDTAETVLHQEDAPNSDGRRCRGWEFDAFEG